MNDQQLAAYIQTSILQGKSKEDLYSELLGQGIKIDRIQANLNSLTSDQQKEDTQKKTINIILTFAALLVGAGIFSFIASNWQVMDKPIKISIIVLSMLTSYALGWSLKEKYQLLKTGEALILLGAIIFGAGIFLVAQMFHIRANWPDGFILWMLGTIALAYALESYPLYYLAIPLGIAAILGHPYNIISSFTASSFLLTSTGLLIVATAITFTFGWSIRRNMPDDLKGYY